MKFTLSYYTVVVLGSLTGLAWGQEVAEREQDRLIVAATDADADEPLAGVSLRFNGSIAGNRYDRWVQTDEEGVASIEWDAGAEIKNLWMTASKPQFVPIHYIWRSERRAIELQDIINLEFQHGQEIGGIVRDEQGEPIQGASVTVRMPVDWPKLDNWVFTASEQVTDGEGRWQWDGAPKDLGRASISIEHPYYLPGRATASPGLDTVTVLEKGLQVTGRVVTTDGEPIAGAIARLGLDRFGTDEPEAYTDAEGKFVLENCKPGRTAVTVQAERYSPDMRALTVSTDDKVTDSGEFHLGPGHTLIVRIVDRAGNPIPGAVMATDTWRSHRTLAFRANADAEGRIQWQSAPDDTILCDFLKTEYMSTRNMPIAASDEEHVVTLHPPLTISGAVTDAATGEPVPAFEVRMGYRWQSRPQPSWSRDEGAHYRDGSYEYKFDEPIDGEYVLQVVAAGYLPASSRPFKSDEGAVTFDFALKFGSGITGTVLSPSGEPAAGVDVVRATPSNNLYLQRGELPRSTSAEVVHTDADGQFTLPPLDDDRFLLFALDDSGFAKATPDQFAASSEIHLQPWGRIEGRVLEGDQPGAGRQIAFYPRDASQQGPVRWSYSYNAPTDAKGRFELDRVVTGPGTVALVVMTESAGGARGSYGWQTLVDIKPGEITPVTIGGTGQRVVGRVQLDRKPDVVVDWTTNEPVSAERWDIENNRRDGSFFRCLGNIAADGRFEIPDVPPGDYKLTITVNGPSTDRWGGPGQAVGRTSIEFSVPEFPGGRSDEPLELGVITAKLFDTLDVGELAPDFVAEKLDGGQLRLRDLWGKLVLVDFWSTQNPQSATNLTERKSLHDAFQGDERFVLLSVSCDNRSELPRDFLRSLGLDWTHAYVGGMNSRTMRDFTVRSLPATFLIGPDGKVIAKNLNGAELEQSVFAALIDEGMFARAARMDPPPRFPVTRFEPAADAELAAEPAVVLLDNCDPNFDKDSPRTDGLRLISADGKELAVIREFNNAQMIGGAHGVAVDAERGRIYIRESAGERVCCFNRRGQKLWQVENVDAHVVVVDPKTGNLWASGGSRGETVVLDPNGIEVDAFANNGVDIAYDPHSDAFWLVGDEILKLNRDGQVLIRKPVDGWICPSVSVNPTNGEVWFIERRHSNIALSQNRLWKLDAEGNLLVNRDLEELNPFAVECNPRSGEVWVATLGAENGGLRRFAAGGEPLGAVDVQAYSLAMGRDGLWIATEEAVLKLDSAGKILVRYELDKPSQQSWLAIFDTE